MPTAVIGRDDELDVIEAFLDALDGGPRALVLSGEPGIGKTVLWETGVAEAKERFACVLSCRGVEAEASLSFAGLSELLGPVLEETAPALLPPRRRALEIALLIAEPGDAPPDPHAIGLAVLDVLRILAAGGSVLVALDDVQWLDLASAGALQLALRRLRDEPVGLLATLREAPGVTEPFDCERLLPPGQLVRLRLGPLGVLPLHQLLKGRLGLELARPELSRLSEMTGGNPFYALELGRELARSEARPEAGRSLRIPGSLAALLGQRLERLPEQVRAVLLIASATARPTADVVAAAHGDSDEGFAALELAAREGVVVLDGPRVRFAHPLLASVCYGQAPLWRQRAVHEALAATVPDVEERSRHLALAAQGPDSRVAAELDAAAQHAASRGATAAAAELAELAARLTPLESPEEHRRRRSQAAWFHRFAGDFERATTIWEALLAEKISGGIERADVLYALATLGVADIPTRIRLCEEAMAEAADDDARVVHILGFLAITRGVGGDVPQGLADAREGLERAERLGDPALLATALAHLGLPEWWALEITPGLLERGVQIEHDLERPLLFHDSPTFISTIQLINLDELDLARERLEELEREALASGDESKRQFVLLQLIVLEWHAGNWANALDHAVAAAELADQTHERQFASMVGLNKALVELDLGLVDRARASAEKGLACAREVGDKVFVISNRACLGRIEVAAGDLEAAAAYLRDLPAELLATGHRFPSNSGIDPWSEAIEVLVALGELERARS
jgi:tetratricopeptide (TPR) repeat protein